MTGNYLYDRAFYYKELMNKSKIIPYNQVLELTVNTTAVKQLFSFPFKITSFPYNSFTKDSFLFVGELRIFSYYDSIVYPLLLKGMILNTVDQDGQIKTITNLNKKSANVFFDSEGFYCDLPLFGFEWPINAAYFSSKAFFSAKGYLISNT